MTDTAISKTAKALELLAVSVIRELDADANQGAPIDDEYWETVHTALANIASECLAVLDQPDVYAALRGDQ